MGRTAPNTSHRGRRFAGPIILGLAIVFLSAGCESAPTTFSPMAPTGPSARPRDLPRQPDVGPPVESVHVRSDPVSLPPDHERVTVPPPPLPRPIIDPTADQIVRSIREAVSDWSPTPNRPLRIGLAGLHNQSRAGRAEFTAVRERLAGLLSSASAGSGVEYAASPAVTPDLELTGAAYLVTRSGFDVWELYLRLTPADRPGIVWQTEGPLYLMRQPRPNQPQFLPLAPGTSR